MPIRPLLAAVAFLATTAATVVTSQTTPSEKARAFTLDNLTPSPATTDPTPTPQATPTPLPSPDASGPLPPLAAPPLPENAATASTAAPVRAVFTLDTPIQDLLADPAAKGVLDKDLPGMSDDENIDKFKMLSLRSLQPQTGGQLTDALLAKVASDLDVLAGGSGTVTAPVKAGNSKRNRDASR